MSMSQASAPQRAPHAKYQRLIERAKGVPAGKTLVVYPCDESSLRGTIEAAEIGIIVPTLVGPVAKMKAVAQQHGLASVREEASGLVELFTLEKLAYELDYEAANRPDWVAVPLSGLIERFGTSG